MKEEDISLPLCIIFTYLNFIKYRILALNSPYYSYPFKKRFLLYRLLRLCHKLLWRLGGISVVKMKVALSQCCESESGSYPTLYDPMDYSLPGSSVHGILQTSTGVSCHLLLQGIFPTWGSSPGLLHYRQILYQLSH